MIRFPNPVSDVINLRKLFTDAVAYASETIDDAMPVFSIDDIGKKAAAKGLVSSSGRIGEEGLKKGYNEDRTLDRVYNQIKMLTELYRMMGWLLPLPQDRSQFVISPIGKQVCEFKGDSFNTIRTHEGMVNEQRLLEWNLLNICFPHPHTSEKSTSHQRTFALILKLASEVGGYMTRDEIIVTALQVTDDRNKKAIQHCVDMITSWRSGETSILNDKDKLSKSLGISTNTMENYTRFPIGAIRSVGWFDGVSYNQLPPHIQEEYRNELGKAASKVVVNMMTETGKRALKLINSLGDLRWDDIKDYPKKDLESLVILFYAARNSCKLDEESLHALSPACDILATFGLKVRPQNGIIDEMPILFEPFQQIPSDILIDAIKSAEVE